MKKHLSIVALATFIVPSVAFASWWNPTTWFNSWSFSSNSDARTQVLEKRIAELESKINTNATTTISAISTPSIITATTTATTTPVVKKEIKKVAPTIGNSAIIEAQVKAQVEATLKAKADQDALVAKQRADAQAVIDAQNAANLAAQQAQAVKDAANIAAQQAADKAAQDAANLAAQQAAQRLAAQQQTTQAAAQAKHDQLNAINQQIATLNAKYAQDVSAASGYGAKDFVDTVIRNINNKYNIDYATLQAQYQQIQYSN